MFDANLERHMGCIWLDRLNMTAHGVPMAAHGPHVAAQRLLLGVLGAAYGCSEAPYGCPWGSIWLLRGCIWLQRGCILLHRGRLWLPCDRYAVHAASGWARLGSQDPGNMASLGYRVVGSSGGPNSRQQTAMKTVKLHSKLKTKDCQRTED